MRYILTAFHTDWKKYSLGFKSSSDNFFLRSFSLTARSFCVREVWALISAPLQISTWISLPVINDHHHWTAAADAAAGQLKKVNNKQKPAAVK